MTDQPGKYVLNTHHHPDHVGNDNQFIGAAKSGYGIVETTWKQERTEGGVKMPRLDFGIETLEGYLYGLLEAIEKGDEVQAEILARLLNEDLIQAAQPRPLAYKRHRVTRTDTGQVFGDLSPYIVTAWHYVRDGNLPMARDRVLRARAIFKESPWYPKKKGIDGRVSGDEDEDV